MSQQDGFAAALVEDYSRLGFATKVNETTLQSFDETTQLALEVVHNATGEAVGLQLFANGDHLVTLSYEDKNFNALLLVNVASLLNL